MADSSFDIVSSADLQEVKNAIARASKEIQTRFDLKGTGSAVELAGEEILARLVRRVQAEGRARDPREVGTELSFLKLVFCDKQ